MLKSRSVNTFIIRVVFVYETFTAQYIIKVQNVGLKLKAVSTRQPQDIQKLIFVGVQKNKLSKFTLKINREKKMKKYLSIIKLNKVVVICMYSTVTVYKRATV